MEKPTVLITGAAGQVGNEFRFLAFTHPQFKFIYTDVEQLDITKLRETLRFFKRNTPQYVVNCAAYTAVDKAETDVALATKINVNGARNLAKACQETGATLIHISTDYVYHNNQNTPFKEGDRTSPKGVYAKTKLRGDSAAIKFCERALVLRTSWVYGSYGNNFVKTMLRLGKEREQLNVVFDQIGTPTYARDLARAILKVIEKIENQEVDSKILRGVFHYSNEGVTSWYDFTKAIFDIREIGCQVNPIESSQYPTPAQRPPFSVLNKAKFRDTFGIAIPHWRDSLIACLKELP
ncbi:MAG: dTDP-4-dehydrorhamnose reductase [Saprospiraceae bacterium]|nr:dTDP-4-dehydrorhamnose reductase [Saprospiraceae bacterium]